MKVPFVDLNSQYKTIKNEIDNIINNVIEEGAFIRGPYVEKFENDYANQYGVKNVISCANGTDAIYIALKALNIGPGDEVITTACSWISTSETISQTGAKVVFVDINSDYYTIDDSKIMEKITDKTKAIIPVHLYGHPSNMTKINSIAKKYDFHVIEDCAQAHFAKWKGQRVGTFGIAGTFSFYPGKNLGAYGDAGAIISDDDDFSEKARMFANHGALKKHYHEIEGINSRLDGIQAGVLSVKLNHIDSWNTARQRCAIYYNQLFENINEIITPSVNEHAEHVFHLYVVRAKRRDELIKFLKINNIDCAVHYPTALPFLNAYRYLGHSKEDFPVAEQYQDQILSLPIYPELDYSNIDFIVNKVKEFYE
tara:strand:+ start:231 stop:1334 length:1104 start_codon:yes stop_codon:yes gene_type:complete